MPPETTPLAAIEDAWYWLPRSSARQLGDTTGYSPVRRRGTIPGKPIATAEFVGLERRFTRRCVPTIRARVSAWTTPRPRSLATTLATDLVRSRHDLLLEHAFLRRQVIVLSRAGKGPAFTGWDRGLPVLLASRLRTGASALLIIQPATVLRWHRLGFQRIWRRSAPRAQPAPLAPATVDLIKQLARDHPLWGAERIRGELLKLGIRVSTRTIQKDMRDVGRRRPTGQSWATFLRNHAHETWACDFLQVTDLLVRPLFAFFLGLIRIAVRTWPPKGAYGSHPWRSHGRHAGAKAPPAAHRRRPGAEVELRRAPGR